MSILIDQSKRVIVQGITGREGQARTASCSTMAPT
jgi:succinyl-CoA synthetase alpha subunit